MSGNGHGGVTLGLYRYERTTVRFHVYHSETEGQPPLYVPRSRLGDLASPPTVITVSVSWGAL